MNKLTENHFSFKCPMNWDEMEVSGNGRHCGKCSKEVVMGKVLAPKQLKKTTPP